MYEYSPIEQIYVKNFRNIGEANIDFKDSPIACLVGENEAGKTSVVKAFGVCALHDSPRDQKDYIRHGCNMFGVIIALKDGTKIVREKSKDINKYTVIKPDGTRWDTSKISEGLPVEVSNIMGLIEEPETKEYLHIRTYEDRLLFITTPDSVNYKVMYDALKVGKITRAIKNGSSEANELKANISKDEISAEALNNNMKSIHILDIEPLLDIRSRLQIQLSNVAKLKKAMGVKVRINESNARLGVLKLISDFQLQEIEAGMAVKLSSIHKSINNIHSLREKLAVLANIGSLNEINVSSVNKLESVISVKYSLSKSRSDLGRVSKISGLPDISESRIYSIRRACEVMGRDIQIRGKLNWLNNLLSQCSEIDNDRLRRIVQLQSIYTKNDEASQKKSYIAQYNNYINQVLLYLKQCGVAFETCTNCGNDVLIDLDKIEQLSGGTA